MLGAGPRLGEAQIEHPRLPVQVRGQPVGETCTAQGPRGPLTAGIGLNGMEIRQGACKQDPIPQQPPVPEPRLKWNRLVETKRLPRKLFDSAAVQQPGLSCRVFAVTQQALEGDLADPDIFLEILDDLRSRQIPSQRLGTVGEGLAAFEV